MASAGLATLARCQERVRSDGVREDKEKKREQERKGKREENEEQVVEKRENGK